ncbi:hypothetical protein Mapa_017736 [Marchantia paleacea]|nr:hypothetical protein Mapa_017736 [Marchantia paleacea]
MSEPVAGVPEIANDSVVLQHVILSVQTLGEHFKILSHFELLQLANFPEENARVEISCRLEYPREPREDDDYEQVHGRVVNVQRQRFQIHLRVEPCQLADVQEKRRHEQLHQHCRPEVDDGVVILAHLGHFGGHRVQKQDSAEPMLPNGVAQKHERDQRPRHADDNHHRLEDQLPLGQVGLRLHEQHFAHRHYDQQQKSDDVRHEAPGRGRVIQLQSAHRLLHAPEPDERGRRRFAVRRTPVQKVPRRLQMHVDVIHIPSALAEREQQRRGGRRLNHTSGPVPHTFVGLNSQRQAESQLASTPLPCSASMESPNFFAPNAPILRTPVRPFHPPA